MRNLTKMLLRRSSAMLLATRCHCISSRLTFRVSRTPSAILSTHLVMLPDDNISTTRCIGWTSQLHACKRLAADPADGPLPGYSLGAQALRRGNIAARSGSDSHGFSHFTQQSADYAHRLPQPCVPGLHLLCACPTCRTSLTLKQRRFWRQLREALYQAPPTKPLVLGIDANGDFTSADDVGCLIGSHLASHDPARNDTCLLDLCLQLGLEAPATFAELQYGDRWSWEHSGGRQRRLDHLLFRPGPWEHQLTSQALDFDLATANQDHVALRARTILHAPLGPRPSPRPRRCTATEVKAKGPRERPSGQLRAPVFAANTSALGSVHCSFRAWQKGLPPREPVVPRQPYTSVTTLGQCSKGFVTGVRSCGMCAVSSRAHSASDGFANGLRVASRRALECTHIASDYMPQPSPSRSVMSLALRTAWLVPINCGISSSSLHRLRPSGMSMADHSRLSPTFAGLRTAVLNAVLCTQQAAIK